MALARNYRSSGAMFDVSGVVPTGATWAEDIYFSEDGSPSDISDLSWKFTFRCSDKNISADITLSTSAGTLSVVDDDDGFPRVLRITVAKDVLSSYDGDYIADLASQDANGVVQLWAHGTVTFVPNPVAF